MPSTVQRLLKRSRVFAVVLPVYWAAAFVGTHLPLHAVPPTPGYSDKSVHFAAMFVLAVLVAVVWRLFVGRVTRVAGCVMLAAIAAYAAVDELTQPWVGRYCDFYDWVADVGGAAAGLLTYRILVALGERRRARRQAEERGASGTATA